MRIGDKVLCTASQSWAAGKEVEIKGIIRDYRTIRDNATLEAMGGIKESDQIIFSLVDADGFRYSSPEGKLADFVEGVVTPEALEGAISERSFKR